MKSDTLYISSTRSGELARWIDANLSDTKYDTMFGTRIDVHFGGGDRVLFELRWSGLFEVACSTLWRDKDGPHAVFKTFISSPALKRRR